MPNIEYQVHIENIGWGQSPVANGMAAGTEGHGLQIEAIKIISCDVPIEYRAQVSGIGWMGWVSLGEIAGTTGQHIQLESLQFRLINPEEAGIFGRAHVQNIGWQPATCGMDPDYFGTVGQGLRMEAIQLWCIRSTSAMSTNVQNVSAQIETVPASLKAAGNAIVDVLKNTSECYKSINKSVVAIELTGAVGLPEAGMVYATGEIITGCAKPAIDALKDMELKQGEGNGQDHNLGGHNDGPTFEGHELHSEGKPGQTDSPSLGGVA